MGGDSREGPELQRWASWRAPLQKAARVSAGG